MKRMSRRKQFGSREIPCRCTTIESLECRRVLDSTTVINEIMYHPADDSESEWIELHNQMAVDMDLSKWSLSDAVSFQFPENTIISGGGYLVVAADPTAFKEVTGLDGAFGPWIGRLNNSGENIELRDRNLRLMSSVEFSDSGVWPAAPDGSGATLSKINEKNADTALASNWESSSRIGGTPGAASVDLEPRSTMRINEVSGTDSGAIKLELINTGESPIELDSASLRASSQLNIRIGLPKATLQPGEIVALPDLFHGVAPQVGDRIFLESTDGVFAIDAVRMTDHTQGRSPDGTGEWSQPETATLGDVNQFHFHDEIVINEIMYHHRPNLAQAESPPVVEAIELISLDGNWRYNASGPSLPTDWHASAHPVGGEWKPGTGVLGFDADGSPDPGIGTILEDPSKNAIVTYYFETDFNVTEEAVDKALGLKLRHLVDDGAVFYLNGQELFRFGMPEGVVTSTTVSVPGVNNATLSEAISLPSASLRAGTNRLSVSVHQSTPLSNDVLFGLELVADIEAAPGTDGVDFEKNEEEWIELFNRGDQTVDLSGWEFSEAIQFDFPENTTIGAGEFLVVANDASSLQNKYPQLTNVVGDFNGKLANSGERIRLLDAIGNPADEVHYFDGGRWDDRADGWGSSLELLDPDADNSSGGAWLASDEARNSEWHTYTYRGNGERTVRGEPSVWNEFAFGLLDGAGEVYVDEISVIEDPDGEAKQLIQNGSFDTGTLDHWRTLGNHQRTSIANDGGNLVMHVVADGATEYQGNQLETTLVDNHRIDADGTYEISFRAKWISGSRQINSRFYFNRAPKTTHLIVPERAGTPGLPNSRLQSNIGPTYEELVHSPLVPKPNENISVSASAVDPDEIQSMTLWFNVDEREWRSLPMTLGDAGNYSAEIPGQSDGAVIQFYVEGSDTRGATSTFPGAGRESRALVIVDEDASNGPLHEFRLVMTDADSRHLHTPTNSLSNQRLGSTVIYQGEAFYDTKVRLKGSFVGRNVRRVGFNIAFNSDQKFRGVHKKVSIDRSTHANLGVDEILLKHAAAHAGGIPTMYDDLIDFVSPRRTHTGKAALRMSGFDDIYLDSQFDNGSDGTLYEYEVFRWPTTTVDGDPESLKRAGGGGDPNGFANIDFRDQGVDKESYRWTNLIVSNRTRDDYGQIIELHQAISASSSEIEAASRSVIDTDQWMRTLAFQSLVGPADAAFTGGNIHNFRLYARPDGKVMYMPWDWDSAFQISTSASLTGSGRLSRLVRAPANLRVYYGHMLDIVATTLNGDYMSRWTDHYGELGGQNFANRLRFFEARSDFATNRIIDRDAPPIEFSIATPKPIVVADTAVTVQGTGWVNIKELRLQGSDEPLDVTWSASDGARVADTWQARIPVGPGMSTVTLEAFDFQGESIGSANVSVESTIENRPLQDFLRISELHYNPSSADGVEFIELTNVSDNVPINLTGVVVADGPSEPLTIPVGTTIQPGQYVLLVSDIAAFVAQYPAVSSEQVIGEFPGRLSDGGERLAIFDADGTVLIDFVYDDDAPWPLEADGSGASLQRRNFTATDADAWFAAAPNPGSADLVGDFNADGVVDVTDIELLSQAARSVDPPLAFDLDGNAVVDEVDRRFLIENVIGTTFGDSNLDGIFNSTDFVVVFRAGEYEDSISQNSTWAEGDWDGDGEFGTRDLVAAFQSRGYVAGRPRNLEVEDVFWDVDSVPGTFGVDRSLTGDVGARILPLPGEQPLVSADPESTRFFSLQTTRPRHHFPFVS